MIKNSMTDSNPRLLFRIRWASFTVAFLLLAMLAWTGTASAQLPIPASTQFDITGFLQEATLTSAADAHSGGTMKVNGHLITVPRETIVIFPANALTWQELFLQAPAPWGIPGNLGVTAFNGAGGTLVSAPTSGMAMADCATATSPCTASPLTTWEVHVIGNRVLGATDQYIAGLIFVSQQGLNSGAGFINFINYTLGEMRVGGTIGSSTTGARVRINDPSGRYSLSTNSPDIRFTVDPDNPTIMSGTGYPACLPRVTPAGPHDDTSDPLCPQDNRPQDLTGNFVGSFTTANLTNTFGGTVVPPPPGTFPDSTKQAPFEVGDYITFSGTLVKDAPAGGFLAGDGPTVGPWPALGTAATYVSAHTIVSNIAIFTFTGSNPAYVETDTTLMGTGGLTILGAAEATIRTRFEGMMTDPSRYVHVYGMDLTTTGFETDRDWGTIGVDPGPPTGAVKGRWRFRPPCLTFGTVPTNPDKQCVMNASGTFLPPTREMRAVIYDPTTLVVSNPGNTSTAANGLIYGQYHAPIMTYIFPENIPGSPIVENNFNAIPFLACGGYTSSAGTLVGELNPWPSNVLPDQTLCAGFVAPPSAVAATATPTSVISGTGALVTLSASASGSTPLTFAWSQAATDLVKVTLTNANTATATFTTPLVAANTTLNFTVTVSNSAGSASATVSVAVAVSTPIVSTTPASPITVASGQPLTITATGADPAGLPLSITWTQTGFGAGVQLNPNPTICASSPSPASCAISFTPTLPIGTTTSTVLTFTVVATNSANVSSAPLTVSVTVNPPSDVITITSAVYRISKQRLTINASDSITSPNITLTLQPYVTTSGSIFTPPNGTFTNNGGGLYIIDLVGVPEPAVPPATPLKVTSNIGGQTTSGLTLIRQ